MVTTQVAALPQPRCQMENQIKVFPPNGATVYIPLGPHPLNPPLPEMDEGSPDKVPPPFFPQFIEARRQNESGVCPLSFAFILHPSKEGWQE